MSNAPDPFLAHPATAVARAHWTIYLPTLVVALVWAGVYSWAQFHQPALPGIRSLALAVEALAVPLLLFFAAVRARVLIVEVRAGHGEGDELALHARSGFARPKEVWIGAREIASIRVRRSLPQRFLGGGALDLRTLSGEILWLTDLDRPEAIAQALALPGNTEFGRLEKALR